MWGFWRHFPEIFIKYCLEHGWKEGLEIDRIDNDGDYIPENIRFVSHTENNQNKRNNKLTKLDVLVIRKVWKTGKFTPSQIAKKYNIQSTHVHRIINNEVWKNVSL